MPIPGKKQNVVKESFGKGTMEAEKEEREVLTETFKEERNASSNARLKEGRGRSALSVHSWAEGCRRMLSQVGRTGHKLTRKL